MEKKICIIKECDNKCHCKGMCSLHFFRFKRHGDPHYKRSARKCKISGCHENYESKGFCKKHYARFRKYGDPLFTKTEQHNMANHSEYHIWVTMKSRCLNPNDTSYYWYGGRGIKVCNRWKNSFKAFYKDMGPRPFIGAQVDREDSNKGYSKGNCRWVTSAVNNQKKYNIKLTMIKAREIREIYKTNKITLRELSGKYGVTPNNIRAIISNKTWKEKSC